VILIFQQIKILQIILDGVYLILIEGIEKIAIKNQQEVVQLKKLYKRSIGVSKAHIDGKYINAPIKAYQTRITNSIDGIVRMSDIGKLNCQTAALKSKHQRISKRSHIFIDKLGRSFIFDSSWEDATAIRLDTLNINWDRPDPIPYEMNGKIHNYFPDFYLPDHNVYLDPKNPYVIIKQKEKLDIISKLITLIIIPSKHECENFSI